MEKIGWDCSRPSFDEVKGLVTVMNPSDNTPTIKMEVEVTNETAGDIQELISDKGWVYEDGLRILLGAGLAAARTQTNWSEEIPQDDLERMKKRLFEVEASLAVLRFKLYEAQGANQAWDLSTGAIRNENIGFRGLINRQKEELDELRKDLKAKQEELNHLRSELFSTQGELNEFPPAIPKTKSWLKKLFRM